MCSARSAPSRSIFIPVRPTAPGIGPITPLEVLDNAGPTPLGMPRPTDPDQDPLTVRIIGLPRGGEMRIDGRIAALGRGVLGRAVHDRDLQAGRQDAGPAGTLDILVEDGRGGSVTASLPITVRRRTIRPYCRDRTCSGCPAGPGHPAANQPGRRSADRHHHRSAARHRPQRGGDPACRGSCQPAGTVEADILAGGWICRFGGQPALHR